MEIINSLYPTLTNKEQKIADIILDREISIQDLTITNIASMSGASNSSVSKFFKKVGFDSFADFRLQYIQDYDKETVDDKIRSSDSIEEMASKLNDIVSRSLEATLQIIDFSVLQQVFAQLKNSDKIYLFGVGASGITCQDLYFKFSRIGKTVIYHSDPHVQLSSLATASKQDLVIAISYSGQTKEVSIPLAHAHANKIKTVSVTALGNNQLKSFSTYELKVPRHESDFRSAAITSRNDSLIIADLLYLGYIHDDYDHFVQALEASQQLTLGLKK